MMDVEIDDRDSLDAVALQHPCRDRDVVEWTESFAVVWESVMKATTDVSRYAEVRTSHFRLRPSNLRLRTSPFRLRTSNFELRISHFQARSEESGLDRAADHHPEPVDHLRRPRQLELRDVLVGHAAGSHLLEIVERVDERELFPRGCARIDGGWAAERRVDEIVFRRRKHVRPDIDAISGRVDNES